MVGAREFLKISLGGSDSCALWMNLEASDSRALHSRAAVAAHSHGGSISFSSVAPALTQSDLGKRAHFTTAPQPKLISLCSLPAGSIISRLKGSLSVIHCGRCTCLKGTAGLLLDLGWLSATLGQVRLWLQEHLPCNPSLGGSSWPRPAVLQGGAAHKGKLSEPRPRGGPFRVPCIPHAFLAFSPFQSHQGDEIEAIYK